MCVVVWCGIVDFLRFLCELLCELVVVVDVEFFVSVVEVCCYCLDGDEERLGDLVVAHVFGGYLGYAQFVGGECVVVGVCIVLRF